MHPSSVSGNSQLEHVHGHTCSLSMEDISASNHRANLCNYASDQLPRSRIITPIFSLSFDGNSSANGRKMGVGMMPH